MGNALKYPYALLQEITERILVSMGETGENATIVAESLVKASARGVHTHGINMLLPLWKRSKAGQLRLPTNLRVLSDRAATALLDGGDGLGPVAAAKAVHLGLEKAKTYGVSTVLIRNTNNLGFLAHYTEMAAAEQTIALMSCNAAPSMAPWGGAEAFVGTNPIAFASYSPKEKNFSMDMATSVVARGKIRRAARAGDPIEPGWAIDKSGKVTTDPSEALEGTLLPFGGAKGSAIALAVDIVSGMLSGSLYGPDLKSFHTLDGPTGVGASLVIIDIAHFTDPVLFETQLSRYLDQVKRMKKADGFTEIATPGERKAATEKNSLVEGVTLDSDIVKSINEILQSAGIENRLENC